MSSTTFRWVEGDGTARGIPEEAASRMATAVSGGGVEGLALRPVKAAWAGEGEEEGKKTFCARLEQERGTWK